MNIDNSLTRADVEPDVFTHSPDYCIEKQQPLEVNFRVISLDAESVKDGHSTEDIPLKMVPSLSKAYGSDT